MNKALGALTGSCASTMPASGHGPAGIDPARKIPHLLASDEEWAAYQARCDALDAAFRARTSCDYSAITGAIEADYSVLTPDAFTAKYAQ